jgi:hypothetical protein
MNQYTPLASNNKNLSEPVNVRGYSTTTPGFSSGYSTTTPGFRSGYSTLHMNDMSPNNNAIGIVSRRPQTDLHIIPDAPTTTGTISYYNGAMQSGPSKFILPNGKPFSKFIENKDYEKYESIGMGGFSHTYKLSFAGNTPHDYILKVTDIYYVRSFAEKEVAILADLKNNPHANKLITAQIEPDIAYILLEYVPGSTLKEWLEKKRTKTELDDMKLKLKRALQSIHKQNIVHTDIKSDNIWVPLNNTLGIIFIDFGLSDYAGTLRKMKGNRQYMLQKNQNEIALQRLIGGVRKTRRHRRNKKTLRRTRTPT